MRFISEMRKARRRRQAAHDLRGLSPDLLADIGIEPDHVDEAAQAMAAGGTSGRGIRPEPDRLLYKAALFMPLDWPQLRRLPF
ncbi:DUF1127 domain-containing protein [Afifella sp. IM 167]|uniref:DUF1127 domain-containing protein n=1 Tax=Afifella sp. IM 167 TaxID=2033586 RepID=UPI001CCD4A4D|nr:DUF1127 domain-containing protein [Afifella sp. IM 167]MBZ8135205.1 hypothetical protein [Afifella sp. IM 167]